MAVGGTDAPDLDYK